MEIKRNECAFQEEGLHQITGLKQKINAPELMRITSAGEFMQTPDKHFFLHLTVNTCHFPGKNKLQGGKKGNKKFL